MKAFTGLHANTENKIKKSEWKHLQAYMPTLKKEQIWMKDFTGLHAYTDQKKAQTIKETILNKCL